MIPIPPETPNMILRTLRLEDEHAFRTAAAEFRSIEPEWEFAFHYDPGEPFADYLRKLDLWSQGKALPRKFVPNTYLVGVVDHAVIGRVSIRHVLNDFLSTIGGHIGYGVVPSQRRKGFATAMLGVAFPIAKSIGMDRLLVTCDDDNIASRRVIEKNGGVFEDLFEAPEMTVPKRRYWIDLR